jgi:transglutaminase-like putative cysteine protease
MAVAPPVKIEVRSQPSPVRGEVAVRYAASFLNTFIAIGAAATAPNLPRSFLVLLVAITLVGLPVSLVLREVLARSQRVLMTRGLISLAQSVFVVVLVLLLVLDPLQRRVGTTLLSPDFFRGFFYHHDADDAILLILQVISIIMVCRCLVLVSDKDTVLSSVPSFCVLVLLIVVERKPGVVVFFVLWAATAAVLFALDQRQEVARRATAFVPAALPGQNVTLSARTLAGLMAFSLVCAIALSYAFTSRVENRTAAEGWVSSLAMKLTQFATALPEVSVNAGPERQIDFTTGPALPTRSPLWRINAQDVQTGQYLTPNYWRMFTLAFYNGTSWSPGELKVARVPLSDVGNVGLHRTLPLRPQPVAPLESPGGPPTRRRIAYNVGKYLPGGFNDLSDFGAPTRPVRVRAVALQQNIGFIPALPVPHYVALPSSRSYGTSSLPDFIAAPADGSVDVRFIEANQSLNVICDVPPSEAYGVPGDDAPLKIGQGRNTRAALRPDERQLYLQLPEGLERVKRLTEQILNSETPDASNYAKALHLAHALQARAAYTLRPPALPEDRDATDFFLFDSRRGYCTYFAGALAVMCRTAGIPARVVSGFTVGDRRPNSFTYLVREANAHAWTEVWVPNWGWATVDATPPAERGDNAADWWTNWADALTTTLDSVRAWFVAQSRTLLVILIISVGLGLLLLRERATLPTRRLTALRLKRRVSDTAARRTIDEVYERAAHALEKRFRARTAWETPHEWLDAALSCVPLKQPAPLQRLTTLYVQALYSPRELGADESADAWRAFSELSWEIDKKT